ncbi:MAG: N-acetylmuramoyl-L-alanine amidase [Clostridiales bacterium]|nr:N-acetylmuramoyl-L-alanine amidase [Clostridiales bacterium]
MTIKTKKTILVTAAITLLCCGIVAGLFLSGGLDRISGAYDIEDDTVTDYPTQTTTVPTIVRTKTERPKKIRGVWFTAGVDFLTDITLTDEQVKNEIEIKIQDIKAIGFNAIFFDWESAVSSRLFDESSDGLSLFGLCLDYARSNNLYIVVALPINEYISSANENGINRKKVIRFFERYNSDALIVSNTDALERLWAEKTTPEIQERTTKYLTDFILSAKLSDELLFVATLVREDNPMMPGIIQNLISEDSSNFLLAEPSASTASVNAKNEKMREDVKSALNNSGGNYIAGQRIDTLFSGEKSDGITAIVGRVSAAENTDNCFGIVFRSYSLIKNDATGLGKAFLEYWGNLNVNGLGSVFAVFNKTTNEIKTNESRTNFTGNCNPDLPLTCNGEKITTSKIGDFSVDYDLVPGINNFEFKQEDKSYAYKVIYEVDILKTVTPKGNITAPGGTVIEITAVALRDAALTATINKESFKMKQTDGLVDSSGEKAADTSSDYVTYFGQYTLPTGGSTQKNLGAVSVLANYNGLSKKVAGAKISVTAIPPETTAATTVVATETATENADPTQITPVLTDQLTPYNYAGVPGVSRMCEVAIEHCETMPLSPLNNVSYLLTSPLIMGMFDYIDGESSFDKYLYYNLRSGKRLYREEVKVIENGYNLPPNKIQTLSSSTEKDTVINLALLWKVPVNVIVKGQNYAQTYNNREFGVWSFTGNSIEFTFSYTTEALGAVDVSGSNIISSAEWSIDSGNKTAILRLYFKRAGLFYGYDISYNKDGSFKILIKNKPSTVLSGYKIMLDPGHGGNDVGAVCISTSPANMKYEKQINLALALKVKERLEAQGATVLMTRTGDSRVELDDRRNMIYNQKPDLCISIHCDGSNKASVFGTSSYYYYSQSFPLANALREQILACYSNNIRPTNDRHTIYYPFRVTRVETCPSVLIEYGFVTNLEECRLLQADDNQNKLAEATVQGIINYIAAN